jgi:predicted metal-dependent HD superfamily phosphohydrolase
MAAPRIDSTTSTAHRYAEKMGEFENKYLVDYADQIGARYIIRGIKPSRRYTEGVMLDRWLALVTRVAEAPGHDVARAVFDDLFARYTGADRRYHDIRHIDDCLQLVDSVRNLASQPDAIELAIWFHDAIYDSHRSDNEESSASLANSALTRLAVPLATRQSVCDLILATKHNAPPTDPDAALLVDIDLSILGQPEPKFDAYEAGVRFEYAWVADSAFRAGRSTVLQSFLDRPRIYTTDYFGAALETAARQNLNRSLANLSG